MKDYALIATAYNNEIRIYVSKTNNLVQKAKLIHDTWPTATAAFGRFLTASAMMGLMYKDDERINLQIKGDGPIGTMIVEANSLGEVKGDIINPHVYIRHETKGKLDVGAAVGNGLLQVSKDLNLKNIFTSSSELVSGEIAEDFANYFLQSEQTATAVSLGVLVNKDQSVRQAGGFIIQVMPDATEETLTLVENTIYRVGPISRWFDENDSVEDLLNELSNGTHKILDKRDLSYTCHCNKEHYGKSLSALDNDTMNDLIADNGIEIVCHYCKKQYFYSKEELEEIKSNQM